MPNLLQLLPRARFAAGVSGLFLSTMLALAAPPPALAEQEPPGKRLYLRYCGACHGPQAKGDGVASSLMRPSPPDLTRLAAQHGGTFPLDLVVKTIDGREMPRAHGDPWMPIWGTVLTESGGSAAGNELKSRETVTAIAEYLRSIQAR